MLTFKDIQDGERFYDNENAEYYQKIDNENAELLIGDNYLSGEIRQFEKDYIID